MGVFFGCLCIIAPSQSFPPSGNVRRLIAVRCWRAAASGHVQPKEWDRERPVILEESNAATIDPEALLWDLLHEALFREERLRRPVIGSPETVAAMSRDELLAVTIGNFTSGSHAGGRGGGF